MRISGGDTDAPKLVRYSFWTWIAAGVVGLLDAVLLWSLKNALIDQAVKANTDPKITPDAIHSGVNNFVIYTLISAVVFGVLYVYFAYRARDGVRSARTVLVIGAVVRLLLGMLTSMSYYALFGVLLSIVAAVLLYMPAARAYYNPER